MHSLQLLKRGMKPLNPRVQVVKIGLVAKDIGGPILQNWSQGLRWGSAVTEEGKKSQGTQKKSPRDQQ